MKILRLFLLLLGVTFLAVGTITNPARGQSEAAKSSATILLNYTDINYVPMGEGKGMDIGTWIDNFSDPIQVTFDASGGVINGLYEKSYDDDLLMQSLEFTGDFTGFPTGQITGDINGGFLAKDIIDKTYTLYYGMCVGFGGTDCKAFEGYEFYTQDIYGTWSGSINEGGTGNGTFEFTISPAPSGGSVKAGMGQTTLSGTWQVTDMQIVALPTQEVTPIILQTMAPIVVEGDQPINPFDEGFSFFPSAEYPPESSARSPLIPIGGALLGTALGFWGVGEWGNKPFPIAASANMVVSPANGKMVTPDEARWHAEKMAEGWVWNETSGGFNASQLEHPSSNQQSILGREASEAAMAAANASSPLDGLIHNLHQERVESIQHMMNRHQQNYRSQIKNAQFYNNASRAASTVKYAADKSMEALAFVTGPAGKGVKLFYDSATASVDVANIVYEEGVGEGFIAAADAAVEIMAGQTGKTGKAVKNIYENAKDGVKFVEDIQNEGLNVASRNLLTKKVGDELKDTFLPDPDEAESLTELMLSSAAKDVGETVIDNGLEQTNELGEAIGEHLFSAKPQIEG